MLPETRYADADGVRIAYQDFGSGPPMLVIPGIVSNIDVMWEHECYRRVFAHGAEHMRTVMMDKRGIGLSDPFERAPTADERIADILAVLDATGLDRVAVSGHSEGGLMAQIFAERHPERVEKLILSCSVVPRQVAPLAEALGGPNHRTFSETLPEWMDILEGWGVDPMPAVRMMHPSRVDDEAFARWNVRYARSAASPTQFARQLESVAELTEASSPDRIEAPTLVIHVSHDRAMGVGNGRALAQLIPDAAYLEVEGTDHFWITQDNWRECIDPQIEFVTGQAPRRRTERAFAAVLFTDLVGSTAQAAQMGDAKWRETIEGHDRIVHRTVAEHGGRIVKTTGDGALATFPVPSAAASAARSIRAELMSIGLRIRAGVHAGEIEIYDNADVSGLAVNTAARVEQLATDGSIFVSGMVRDMLAGSGHELVDRGVHELKGIDEACRLFELL